MVTGMVMAGQHFKQLATINVACEITLFVPLVLLAQYDVLGTVSLSTLIWIDVVVESARLGGMLFVVKEILSADDGTEKDTAEKGTADDEML